MLISVYRFQLFCLKVEMVVLFKLFTFVRMPPRPRCLLIWKFVEFAIAKTLWRIFSFLDYSTDTFNQPSFIANSPPLHSAMVNDSLVNKRLAIAFCCSLTARAGTASSPNGQSQVKDDRFIFWWILMPFLLLPVSMATLKSGVCTFQSRPLSIALDDAAALCVRIVLWTTHLRSNVAFMPLNASLSLLSKYSVYSTQSALLRRNSDDEAL